MLSRPTLTIQPYAAAGRRRSEEPKSRWRSARDASGICLLCPGTGAPSMHPAQLTCRSRPRMEEPQADGVGERHEEEECAPAEKDVDCAPLAGRGRHTSPATVKKQWRLFCPNELNDPYDKYHPVHHRFERRNIPSLCAPHAYFGPVHYFQRDVASLSRHYNPGFPNP